MAILTDFDDTLLKIEQALFDTEIETEQCRIGIAHVKSVINIIVSNINILKQPGIIVSLDQYKKSLEELKFLESGLQKAFAKERELERKMEELEKSLKCRQDAQQYQQAEPTKVLVFSRREHGSERRKKQDT